MYLNKCSGAKIGRDLHMSRNTVYVEIKFLIENGFTGKEPIIKPIPQDYIIELPDKLVESMIKFKLTDEQRQYIMNNRHLSRTEMSRKLGIKKSNLLYVLQKMNINMETKMSWKV
jgi:hypothetical protein